MRKDLILYNVAGILGMLVYVHLIISYFFSSNKYVINEDIRRWEFMRPQYFSTKDSHVLKLSKLLFLRSEFRVQFLFRIGGIIQYLLRPTVLGGGIPAI